MTAPVITMNKQKKELVQVKGGIPASAAKMLPTLWADRGYADFNDMEELGDKLLSQATRLQNMTDQLEEAIGNYRLTQKHIDHVEAMLADERRWGAREEFEEYQQMRAHWERGELYQRLKKPKHDHRGVLVNHVIRAEVVGCHVAGILAYCEFKPASEEAGEIFTAIMIEDIRAARPSASALESTCREIRRLDKFIRCTPKLPEVRALLEKHEQAWSDRHPDNIDPQNTRSELRDVLVRARLALIEQEEKARAAKIEAEAEAARKQAERLAAAEAEAERQKVDQERRNTELEEQAACRAAEAKAKALRQAEEAKAAAARAARRLAAAYPRGRRFANDYLSMPLNDQLREGIILYGCYLKSEMEGRVSFALGIFERRRGRRAWRQEWARGKFGLPIWA
jgi:hypothetical protein